MIYLLLAALASYSRRPVERLFLMTAAFLLVLLVGLSRAFLGVHWPTDILAGWALGAGWALAAAALFVWRTDRSSTLASWPASFSYIGISKLRARRGAS